MSIVSARLSNNFVFSTLALDATGSFACTPRLVPQSLETLGKVTYPRCTFVKRCGGCCPAARECVADRTTTKLVNVFEIVHCK